MYSNRPEFKTAKFWRILEIFRNIDIHNVQVVAVHVYMTPLVTYYETILESLPSLKFVQQGKSTSFSRGFDLSVNVKQTCLFSLIYNCLKTLVA